MRTAHFKRKRNAEGRGKGRGRERRKGNWKSSVGRNEKKLQTPQPGIKPATPANAADALPMSHRDEQHHQPVHESIAFHTSIDSRSAWQERGVLHSHPLAGEQPATITLFQLPMPWKLEADASVCLKFSDQSHFGGLGALNVTTLRPTAIRCFLSSSPKDHTTIVERKTIN